LLTGLSTSSFFLANYLTRIIEKNEHTTTQLNFAIAQENEAALLYAWQQSKHGSENWQNLAKKLAKNNGEFAYLLANFYFNKESLGTNSSSQLEQAILWYQQAIRLNYSRAPIALAELNFHQGNVSEALHLLAELNVMDLPQTQVDDITLSAVMLTIKIAISTGNIELVNSLLSKFSSSLVSDEVGASLLNMINKYQVLTSRGNKKVKPGPNLASCPNSIQFFATNLSHLAQVERLVKRFNDQPLNDFVCFFPVRYISLSTLSCSSAPHSAILCDETKLDKVADSLNTRYIGIMLPEGGANVHLGILYFDAQDNIDVVEHEVSHLLGFVDEYPLVKGHIKCRASQQQVSSQNIAVLKNGYYGERKAIRTKILKQLAWAEQIKKSTPILHLKKEGSHKNQYWQLGTPEQYKQEVGLFRSLTCDNNSVTKQNTFNAFKPLSDRTKLQYDELNFSKEYIRLLLNNSQQFVMPSFHYNIALAYYQQNNIKQATVWLEQAADWESDDGRRKKVLQGEF
jgi:TPR repeat protein